MRVHKSLDRLFLESINALKESRKNSVMAENTHELEEVLAMLRTQPPRALQRFLVYDRVQLSIVYISPCARVIFGEQAKDTQPSLAELVERIEPAHKENTRKFILEVLKILSKLTEAELKSIVIQMVLPIMYEQMGRKWTEASLFPLSMERGEPSLRFWGVILSDVQLLKKDNCAVCQAYLMPHDQPRQTLLYLQLLPGLPDLTPREMQVALMIKY